MSKRSNMGLLLNGRLLFVAFAVNIGSVFQYGYNLTVVNVPQEKIFNWARFIFNEDLDRLVTNHEIQTRIAYSAASLPMGCALGAALTAFVGKRFGRQRGMMYNNIAAFVGISCMFMAKILNSIEVFLVGRLLVGFTCGLNIGLSVMYLCEVVPTRIRGAILGSIRQIYFALSMNVSYVLGNPAVLGTEDNWHVLFLLALIPTLLQIICLPICPQSPRYLWFDKHDHKQAEQALVWLRGDYEMVAEEIEEIKEEQFLLQKLPKVTILSLFNDITLRTPLIIVLAMKFFLKFCGMETIYATSNRLFSDIGMDCWSNFGLAMAGILSVLSAVLSIFLIDKYGRRKLTLWGLSGVIVSTSILIICHSFLHVDKTSSTCHFHWNYMLSLMCIHIIYGVTIGPITYTLMPELFNYNAKPLAISLSLSATFVARYVTSLILPSIHIYAEKTLYLALISDIILFLFMFAYLPDTSGMTWAELITLFH